MNPIAHHPSFTSFPRGYFTGGTNLQAEQTRAGSISQRQTTDLTMTTDEGDTVTLSLASAMEANAGVFRRLSIENGTVQSSRTAFFEFSGSQQLSIEIDGDLNAEELEDIREAVAVIGNMIEDFLSGDLREMAAEGASLTDLDSIASLNAAFSYERQVLYGEQEKVEISRIVPQNSPRGHRRGHGQLRRLLNRIDRLTDDMTDQVRGFGGRRDRLARSVDDLLRRYGSGEMNHAPEDAWSRSAIQTTQSMFAQKIDMLSESSAFDLVYSA